MSKGLISIGQLKKDQIHDLLMITIEINEANTEIHKNESGSISLDSDIEVEIHDDTVIVVCKKDPLNPTMWTLIEGRVRQVYKFDRSLVAYSEIIEKGGDFLMKAFADDFELEPGSIQLELFKLYGKLYNLGFIHITREAAIRVCVNLSMSATVKISNFIRSSIIEYGSIAFNGSTEDIGFKRGQYKFLMKYIERIGGFAYKDEDEVVGLDLFKYAFVTSSAFRSMLHEEFNVISNFGICASEVDSLDELGYQKIQFLMNATNGDRYREELDIETKEFMIMRLKRYCCNAINSYPSRPSHA